MTLTIHCCQGADILPRLDDLARLRIAVFRDFPYLYEGSLDYERHYLSTYAHSPESLFVLALDGDQVVGASTGLPMSDETEEVKAPLRAAGIDPESVFYFGESVLLADYRGAGIGVRFFTEREAYARRLGRFDRCCFCAVDRPDDHPLRPKDHEPLNAFWHNRGYVRHPTLKTRFRWRDIGQDVETEKPMSFWFKPLD
mgnify:CR=1 FL=1